MLTHSVSASVNYTEIYDWVKNEPKSDAPTAGTILTNDDTDVLNKWIPPGMIEEFKFPELKLVIQETKVEKPHSSYISATKNGLTRQVLIQTEVLLIILRGNLSPIKR